MKFALNFSEHELWPSLAHRLAEPRSSSFRSSATREEVSTAPFKLLLYLLFSGSGHSNLCHNKTSNLRHCVPAGRSSLKVPFKDLFLYGKIFQVPLPNFIYIVFFSQCQALRRLLNTNFKKRIRKEDKTKVPNIRAISQSK